MSVPSDAALAFSALRSDDRPSPEAGPHENGVLADAQLVALAHEVPAQALEALYAAYRGRIYGFLLRLLSDPEQADDLTQDTFTKAYSAFSSLTREHRVLPWLYRIANNAAIDHLRRRKRIPWLRLGGLSNTHLEPESADDHERIGQQESLRKALEALPAENSAALLLHALEGYSYAEIAEIQGCSMTAVRSRIARAREGFKRLYDVTGETRQTD